MKKPKWKRTGSKTITAYNLPLERAYALIFGALAEQDSGQDEKVREVVNIQITHKKRVK